jgi:hypothetical protein
MRLFIVVEGQTEERLVKDVLTPHLEAMNVWAIPIIVTTSRQKTGAKNKGGGRWAHWRNDLMRLSNGQRGNDVRFTTLFDLYGLPGDFPNYTSISSEQDTIRRAEKLEAAMLNDIGDDRLIPYIQRHEIEALVLVDLEALAKIADPGPQAKGVVALQRNIAGLAPEDINDGPTTTPSKRLLSFVPGYSKILHGPLVIEAVGLPKIRAACPRFNAWITNLESLATSSPPNQP